MLCSLQDEVLTTEKVLVEGLRFDLVVELPYSHLFKFVELLEGCVFYLMISHSVCLFLCIKLDYVGISKRHA